MNIKYGKRYFALDAAFEAVAFVVGGPALETEGMAAGDDSDWLLQLAGTVLAGDLLRNTVLW